MCRLFDSAACGGLLFLGHFRPVLRANRTEAAGQLINPHCAAHANSRSTRSITLASVSFGFLLVRVRVHRALSVQLYIVSAREAPRVDEAIKKRVLNRWAG